MSANQVAGSERGANSNLMVAPESEEKFSLKIAIISQAWRKIILHPHTAQAAAWQNVELFALAAEKNDFDPIPRSHSFWYRLSSLLFSLEINSF